MQKLSREENDIKLRLFLLQKTIYKQMKKIEKYTRNDCIAKDAKNKIRLTIRSVIDVSLLLKFTAIKPQ